MSSPIAGLLAAHLATDAAGPFITYYDDETGERTELSATTLANWVAKTANLLQDGLDVEAGQEVAVLLDPHWQSAAVLLATWAVGAVVTETAPADVVVTSEARFVEFQEADAGVREIVALSLHPLGRPLATKRAGVTDYADVLLYGDDFVPYSPVDPDALALRAGSLELTARSVASAATELAVRMGLVAGDRLLVDVELVREGGPLPWLLAPLAAGASIVLCRRPDPDRLRHRAETERVTVTMGVHVEGLRAVGR